MNSLVIAIWTCLFSFLYFICVVWILQCRWVVDGLTSNSNKNESTDIEQGGSQDSSPENTTRILEKNQTLNKATWIRLFLSSLFSSKNSAVTRLCFGQRPVTRPVTLRVLGVRPLLFLSLSFHFSSTDLLLLGVHPLLYRTEVAYAFVLAQRRV